MEPTRRGFWTAAIAGSLVALATIAGALLDLGGGERGTAVAQGAPPRAKGPLPKGTPVRGPEGLPPEKGGVAPKTRPGTPPAGLLKEVLAKPRATAVIAPPPPADREGRAVLRSGEIAQGGREYRLGSPDGLLVAVPAGIQLKVGGLFATESGPRILLVEMQSGSTIYVDTINAVVSGYEVTGDPAVRGLAERAIKSITVRRGTGQ